MAVKMNSDLANEYVAILDKRVISLKRFNDGGAPILQIDIINHHAVIMGEITISPLDRKILRVFEVSYKEFDRKKRPELDNPWAIIIIIEPSNPQFRLERSPRITNDIWLTEE